MADQVNYLIVGVDGTMYYISHEEIQQHIVPEHVSDEVKKNLELQSVPSAAMVFTSPDKGYPFGASIFGDVAADVVEQPEYPANLAYINLDFSMEKGFAHIQEEIDKGDA